MLWVKRIVVWVLVVAVVVPAGFRGAAALRERVPLAEALPGEGRVIETAAGGIFVQEAGPEEGPVLLFAHGTAAWSGLWRPVVEEMGARGWRAVAFDMPPFGYSDRDAEGEYGRVRQAERLLALVEALEVRPVLVAHSYGAGPGIEAVMRAPEAFAGLVVVNGAIGLGSHETDTRLPLPLRSRWGREAGMALSGTNPLLTGFFLRGLIHVKEAATDEVVAVLQRPLVREGTTRAFAQWLPTLLLPPDDALSTRAESYGALALPVAYIWGEEDTVTPLSQGEALADLTPGAQLITLPGVGHIPQIEDRAAFTLALDRALGSIPGAPAQ